LSYIQNDRSSNFILRKDLDFNSANSYAGGSVNTDWCPSGTTGCNKTSGNADEGWTSVGTAAEPFTGTLNGNGHSISHLFLRVKNSSSPKNNGLFGVIDGGTIRGLRLENANVYGVASTTETSRRNAAVGTLAGRLSGGGAIIASSSTGGSVLGTLAPSTTLASADVSGTGGLVGYVNNGQIIASFSTVTVNGVNAALDDHVGGLAGRLNTGVIYASYSSGDVNPNRGKSAGGLVGWFQAGSVINSYSASFVSSTGGIAQNAGGLAGQVSSSGTSITKSYSFGRTRIASAMGSGSHGTLDTAGITVSSTANDLTQANTSWNLSVTILPTGTFMGPWDFQDASNPPQLLWVTNHTYTSGTGAVTLTCDQSLLVGGSITCGASAVLPGQ
jgi:uncharacterized Zn-binding protein involved in type VI secretion